MKPTEQLFFICVCTSVAYALPENRVVVGEGRPLELTMAQSSRDRQTGETISSNDNSSENSTPSDLVTGSTPQIGDFEVSTPSVTEISATEVKTQQAPETSTISTKTSKLSTNPVTAPPDPSSDRRSLKIEQVTSTINESEWKDVDSPVTPYISTSNPSGSSGPGCKFGQTPAWQFVKCKAKALARKANQAQGDAFKWTEEKRECLVKISKGAGQAIEQTRRCLANIQLSSRDINEQLKSCFTRGDDRPENREWIEGIVCFTGLSGKSVGVLQQVARVVVLYIVQVGYRAMMIYFSNGITEKIFI